MAEDDAAERAGEEAHREGGERGSDAGQAVDVGGKKISPNTSAAAVPYT